MSVRLNTNIASLSAQRRLGEATSSLGKTYERLASGLRVVRASDDAAGLAVASGLNVDARISNQAVRNVSDGISLLNIAEGALESLSTIVIRIAELSEQAANGTLGNSQRESLDKEAMALHREYSRITASLEFNTRKVFEVAQTIEIQNAITGTAGLLIELGAELSIGEFAGTFATPLSQSTVTNFRLATVQDLNGDGSADRVTWNTGGNRTNIELGNGDGTFRTPVSYLSHEINSIGFGDINGDGVTDIVGAGQFSKVLLGNGDGTFLAAVSSSTGLGWGLRDVADLNDDGREDMIFANATGGFQTLLSNGNGTFRYSAVATHGTVNLQDIRAFDANNDGRMDLLLAGSGISPVIALQNGDGTFRIGQDLNYPSGSFVGYEDIDHDGIKDLVTRSGDIRVYRGNGDGTFAMGRVPQE